MPIKWRLFGIASYMMLAVYLFVLVMLLRFIVEAMPGNEGLTSLIPFISSTLIIILNSFFNIYIFHKHLPGKPFSRAAMFFYILSTVLYAISLAIIIITLNRLMSEELIINAKNGYAFFLQVVFFLNLVIGLFIFANQFLVRKYIEKNYRNSLNNQIEDIGK